MSHHLASSVLGTTSWFGVFVGRMLTAILRKLIAIANTELPA